MSTQIAELGLSATAASHGPVEHSVADDARDPERPFAAARGIVNAVLIAAPFWALFALALYLLI